MRALLISTYDLGRQPFGLASPAAWLRREHVEVDCVDVSRERLEDAQLNAASVIAFYLPMHTATRLAAPLIERAGRVNPSARLCAYGLYASLNEQWLRDRGIHDVLGPEAEEALVGIAKSQIPNPESQPIPNSRSQGIARLQFITPDRRGLPPLGRYASLEMPDGSHRIIGSTDATRGCKHLCRHCPIVPVYKGQFRVVPVDVVIDDIRAQVSAGAQHITFGDPDFLNGPTHTRRIVERLAREFPRLSYDVTIKIEHLIEHADMLPLLRETGCLFITSAVESIDDEVLVNLRKGHTRADFVRATALCGEAGVLLVPTFVAFTPWTTISGYVELLELIDGLNLVEQVAPIQLAIRLLVTAESPLRELEDIRRVTGAFDPGSLTWPWQHADPQVDVLQNEIMQIVLAPERRSRSDMFASIHAVARSRAGLPPLARLERTRTAVPILSEGWYCCAEPSPDQMAAV